MHHPGADSPGAASRYEEATSMEITIAHITPIVALIAGILILFVPRIVSIVVAIWLILYGVLGLWPNLLNGVL
jgi:hypothetical protein